MQNPLLLVTEPRTRDILVSDAINKWQYMSKA
jgi:hypothetical protein